MLRIFRPATLLFLALAAAPSRADDARLAELHAQLAPMRATRGDSAMRGATPALMTVKHGLRDWIEAHLTMLAKDGDEQAFSVRLNDELGRADLSCKESTDARDRCAKGEWDWDGTGFLEPLHVERQEPGSLLLVRAGVGVLRGADESAYLYEWRDGNWRRLWQTEQAIEPGKPFAPQFITGVHTSWRGDKSRLVISLGYAGGCTSSWTRVFYRLWRVEAGETAATPLLDRTEVAWIGAHDPPIEGSVGTADALDEFTVGSLDSGVHSYEAIRHYAIDGNRVERIDPIALSPTAFTEEWLKYPWAESAAWTAPQRRDALRPWHARFHADYISGDYIDQPQRCRETPDLWQVGIDFRDVQADKSIGAAYFFIVWQPPYHFEMTDIAAKPRPGCDRPAPPNDVPGTLFPIQGWR